MHMLKPGTKLNWSGVGWFWFWALALLVLPDCGFSAPGFPDLGDNLKPGSGPHTSTIFCDIEVPEGRRCASPAEIDAAEKGLSGAAIRLKGAAIALVAGKSGMGLDYSPVAQGKCAEVVTFHGKFPQGLSVCLDCTAIGPSPSPYLDANAVCVARCLDLFSSTDANVPASPEAITFCASRARISTNHRKTGCYTDACTTTGETGGTPIASFDDQRRRPEPVIWHTPAIGVEASDGSLKRTTVNKVQMWDAGAFSKEVIQSDSGDGYVEFIAAGTSTRMIGLSSGADDNNPSFTDIDFGIVLYDTGEVHLFEKGVLVPTEPEFYAPGDKFRVKVKDKFNGTAAVTYVHVTEPCVDGTACAETEIHPSSGVSSVAAYPFRVDSSFYDQGATLSEVRLVRIIKP